MQYLICKLSKTIRLFCRPNIKIQINIWIKYLSKRFSSSVNQDKNSLEKEKLDHENKNFAKVIWQNASSFRLTEEEKILSGVGGRGFAPPRQRGQIGLKCFKGIVFMGLIAIQLYIEMRTCLFNTKETVLMLIAWVFITKKRCLSVWRPSSWRSVKESYKKFVRGTKQYAPSFNF